MTQLNSDLCFVFTDTETTGLNINFSQIIQVGSLLTDESLVVEEEQDLSSKLLPWVIPSPEALLVNKKMECLSDEGFSHYEMMVKLHNDWSDWAKKRNPVFITYNGHKFDEELLRRQFYWCLLDPYITNTGGATRLDLMYTFQVIANFFFDSMVIPINEDGDISLKLTDWAECNDIPTLNAHDALADCYLMVNLSRIIKKKAKAAWDSSLQGSSKDGNLRLLQSEPFAMLGEVIRKKKFTYPVTFCGQNQKMNNEVAVVDLYYDPDSLDELTDSELLDQIGTSGTGIRKLRINKSMPLIEASNIPSIQEYLDVPFEQLEERANKVRNNTKFQKRVTELMSNNQPQYPPPKYIEQAVYSGFASNEDKLWMERFHSTPWEERYKLVQGFEDVRYRELSERLIFSRFHEQLQGDDKKKYDSFIKQRFYDKGPWLDLTSAREKTSSLLDKAIKENRDEDKQLLEKLLDKLLETSI